MGNLVPPTRKVPNRSEKRLPTPEGRLSVTRRSAAVPHGFSITGAARAQTLLASKAVKEDVLEGSPELVAGVDVAYDSRKGAAAAVIISMKDHCERESRVFLGPVRFPYVPTFLAFREARFIFAVLRRLETRPDVLMVNGHGFAHPRRCGLATHVGVVEKIPCIGVASSLLKGYTIAVEGGDNHVLDDEERIVAEMIKTPKGSIYVSVGNMISLKSAVEIVTRLIDGGRLPLPIRMAHKAAGSLLRDSRACMR